MLGLDLAPFRVLYELHGNDKVVELVVAERQSRKRNEAAGGMHLFALVDFEVGIDVPVNGHRLGAQHIPRI